MCITLSYPLRIKPQFHQLRAVVSFQPQQRVDFIDQMFHQRGREAVYNLFQGIGAITLWCSILSVLQEEVQAWGKDLMLLVVAFHETRLLGEIFNRGEQRTFFGVMVVLHSFHPRRAEEQEITDIYWGADMWCL